MSGYTYLLFDADDTLFDFSKASCTAFRVFCKTLDIPCTAENEAVYHSISETLWARFDRNEVTKEYLVVERFVRFLEVLGVDRDPAYCNEVYLSALAEGNVLFPEAEGVCRALAEDHALYIITNAVASVQRRRLEASAIAPYFRGAFISEEAGAAKPSRAYFDYVRAQLPGLTEKNSLVIGDSLHSDIQGANNAGLPCCWYNPRGLERPEGLRIDYEIRDLRELLSFA